MNRIRPAISIVFLFLGLCLADEHSPGDSLRASKNHIQRRMNFAKSKIKELYLRKLREDSDFAGRVKVRFYIESDGTTRDFEVVESTTADPAFDRELIEVLKRRLRFKDRYIHETIEIVYPFAFTSPDP